MGWMCTCDYMHASVDFLLYGYVSAFVYGWVSLAFVHACPGLELKLLVFNRWSVKICGENKKKGMSCDRSGPRIAH